MTCWTVWHFWRWTATSVKFLFHQVCVNFQFELSCSLKISFHKEQNISFTVQNVVSQTSEPLKLVQRRHILILNAVNKEQIQSCTQSLLNGWWKMGFYSEELWSTPPGQRLIHDLTAGYRSNLKTHVIWEQTHIKDSSWGVTSKWWGKLSFTLIKKRHLKSLFGQTQRWVISLMCLTPHKCGWRWT